MRLPPHLLYTGGAVFIYPRLSGHSGQVCFRSFSYSNSFILLTVFLFLYHLQNLVGKASHSLDCWMTVLLVYVMKGDDRNLIGLADLFY